MKAPDIIYMPEVILDESWTEKIVDTDVCYLRKDAFIEKVCNAYCKVCKMPNCRSNGCKWVSEFKRHLETI